MADAAVEISGGSGIFIDTRTEAGSAHHRQVIVVGDPSVNSGVAPVSSTNGLSVNITNASLAVATHAVTQSGAWTVDVSGVSDVDVLTMPLDPFGTNADAANPAGSMSAKLRFIATNGIPVQISSHEVTNAGTFAVQVTSIAAGDNNIGNVDVVSMPAMVLGAGDNNIGNVDVVSMPAMALGASSANIGDVDVLTLPAIPTGANTIGKVDVNAGTAMVGHVGGTDYETVGASASNQALGATGAAGDYLGGLLVIPGTTSAGSVSIKDGSLTAVVVFAGAGTTPLSSLIPFFVPIGAKSTNGGWQVSTGTNVTAIGVGDFT